MNAKITAMLKYSVPQTRHELCRIPEMTGCYCSFCRNFAQVVAPLTSLTSEKNFFVWSPACQHAFESCKTLFYSTSVLAAPDFTSPFKLEEALVPAVWRLREDKQGADHPFCYFSKKVQCISG